MKEKNNYKYKLCDDNITFSVKVHESCKNIKRTNHKSKVFFTDADEEFNRGIKRGNTILATGDRPRFALLRTFPEDNMAPDLIKMGDCRIRIVYGSEELWLDKADEINTIFKPYGTSYTTKYKSLPEIIFELSIYQAGEYGVIAKLIIKNGSDTPVELKVEFDYGGLTLCGRTFSAAYFSPDTSTHSEGNSTKVIDDMAVLSDDRIKGKVYVFTEPKIMPSIINSRALFSYRLFLEEDSIHNQYFLVGHVEEDVESTIDIQKAYPKEIIKESIDFYKSLLSDYSIVTPNKVLNSAFNTAIVNLEYGYAYPAWLEGVHWWSSYWANNYQISAAVSLGQIERAKKALEFFAGFEYGPGPILYASGNPAGWSGTEHLEDALPYYLHQFIQYYNSTGDIVLCMSLWPKIKKAIKYIFEVRDSNKNYLLDWHLHCNAFMYQADHLGMPGDAASPSLMIAGMLEKLSYIADESGKHVDGEVWRNLAENIYCGLIEFMWNNDKGVFYNHIDYQGIKHIAHYYTDMVFPILYTSLGEEFCRKSMDYLSKTLLFETIEDKRLLMRVGDFKPSIFGNDNVMPAQMCEAARAFFKIGDSEKGLKLLSSVALAATLHTEAPGSFPEHMGDDGKGEANYIFGNPTGSFIYTVIEGLFGLSIVNGGSTIKWSPSLPEDWDIAEFSLPYAKISFSCKTTEIDENSTDNQSVKVMSLILESDTERILDFEILLNSSEIIDVLYDEAPVDYYLGHIYGKMHVKIRARSSKIHRIYLKYVNEYQETTGMEYGKVRPLKQWYETADNTCFSLKQNSVIPLDISEFYNSTSIKATSAWRNNELEIDLLKFMVNKNMVNIEGIPFKIQKDEIRNATKIVLLEYGKTHDYSGKLQISDKPCSIAVPVNKITSDIVLLYASEMQSRHTGCRVGAIELLYSDGLQEEVPLVAGKNIDTLYTHFAEDTIPVQVGEDDYINILILPVRDNLILKEVSFKVDAADVQFGLISISTLCKSL